MSKNAAGRPLESPKKASRTGGTRVIGHWLWRWLPGWVRRLLLWRLNAHFIVGTVAVVRDTQGRVLLARHTYRRRDPWALPGGWVRRGEDPADAVAREIFEETGLRVKVLAPLTIQRESPVHLTIVYAARLIEGTVRPSPEVSEARFVIPGAWPTGLREEHRVLLDVLALHGASWRGAP